MATTGERIRQARKARNMTQTELAEKLGVKFSAIHKYETGLVVNLKRETIAALAKALDVSLCVWTISTLSHLHSLAPATISISPQFWWMISSPRITML